MAYDPNLADPISRVRYAVGDSAATPLFPDATYTALLVSADGHEPTAIRAAAAGLAAFYATQPSTLTSDGSTLTWGERISQWNDIATGAAGFTQPLASTARRGSAAGRLTAGADFCVR